MRPSAHPGPGLEGQAADEALALVMMRCSAGDLEREKTGRPVAQGDGAASWTQTHASGESTCCRLSRVLFYTSARDCALESVS